MISVTTGSTIFPVINVFFAMSNVNSKTVFDVLFLNSLIIHGGNSQ